MMRTALLVLAALVAIACVDPNPPELDEFAGPSHGIVSRGDGGDSDAGHAAAQSGCDSASDGGGTDVGIDTGRGEDAAVIERERSRAPLVPPPSEA